MAIKTIYICDRCGKEYDKDDYVKIGELLYSDMKLNLSYKDKNSAIGVEDLETLVDFCPKCAREFIDWCGIKYDVLTNPLYV